MGERARERGGGKTARIDTELESRSSAPVPLHSRPEQGSDPDWRRACLCTPSLPMRNAMPRARPVAHSTRSHDEPHWFPIGEARLQMTRRHFFGLAGAGLGITGARQPARPRPARGRLERRAAGAAALCAEGETHHLPLPVGRSVADGPVRLQAGARALPRRRGAGFGPDGPAADRNDGQAGELPGLLSIVGDCIPTYTAFVETTVSVPDLVVE